MVVDGTGVGNASRAIKRDGGAGADVAVRVLLDVGGGSEGVF